MPSDDSEAIQPQYAHTVRLKGLCELFHDEIDATPEIENLLRYVADPATAHGVFLDWLGDRVGVIRVLQTADGPMTLSDEDFRFLVMVKALQNISGESAADINRLISVLLGGTTWVVDNGDMTIDVHILADVPASRIAILRTYGLPNKPAGVRAKIYYINPNNGYLGFNGSLLLPFDQGIFYQYDPIYDGGED